jgi:hypothetical protein
MGYALTDGGRERVGGVCGTLTREQQRPMEALGGVTFSY